MTTRQRMALIAGAHPRLFPRRALEHFVRSELGSIDALDRWVQRGSIQVRARAPKMIYHVCAGNLAISACTSLVHGLILGAENVIKLPSAREDSDAKREIAEFVHGLPPQLRRLVKAQSKVVESDFTRADVVVAFGSDATLDALRQRPKGRQKLIAHGHAVSLLWLGQPNLNGVNARACAVDILTYDQLGCLSPQAIYFPVVTDVEALGGALAAALERHWTRLEIKPRRGLAVAARISEARDLARALGYRLWLPSTQHLGWTIIHDGASDFRPSPLHGVIYLRQVGERRLSAALSSVAGRISTVGFVGKLSAPMREAFCGLGVSRFCPAGRMQFPSLTWRHDGRPTLADLVTWSEMEG